jgi:hypothetical protein
MHDLGKRVGEIGAFALSVLLAIIVLDVFGIIDVRSFREPGKGARSNTLKIVQAARSRTLDSHHPEWTSTSISVATGDTLRFQATGTFQWDPSVSEPVVGPDGASWIPTQVSRSQDFQLPGARMASLIGRVGNWVFPIGASHTVQTQVTGELYLGINERWVPGAWNDNQGALQITVQVEAKH